MRIKLYESRMGSLWFAPEGETFLIAMEPLSGFKIDAQSYRKRWSEKDCPEYVISRSETHVQKLKHVATYEDGVVTVHTKTLQDNTKGYLGIGVGNAAWNAMWGILNGPQHEDKSIFGG